VTARAAELRRALDAGVCSFDLDGVSAIDTAGVQLLLALAQEGARRQQALSLRGGAAVVTEATRALGLATRLALTTEAS
jgi:ABC-type transporter Mla MlaB component